MSERIVSSVAPSNIALIKYMGKRDASANIPENSSLSMTLDSLRTCFEITVNEGSHSEAKWVPEIPRSFERTSNDFVRVPTLDEKGMGRVIRHFERVRSQVPGIFQKYDLEFALNDSKPTQYILRSVNTFPASSGIASSASSFAALTLAAAAALAQNRERFDSVWNHEPAFRRELAQISRLGSGSSCRSFEGPWVLWKETEAEKVPAPEMPEMAHFVILVKTDPKRVSSSEAHTLIRTSPLWEGRPARVENRTQLALRALAIGDVATLARIAWTEAWEMHSLFHTCAEPFTYWEPGTIDILHAFSPWIQKPSPPIVTLDAGPNIHVIVKKSDREVWKSRIQEVLNGVREFQGGFGLLEDQQGNGPKLRYS
jgi:diphosphomevalonate decarboxylase